MDAGIGAGMGAGIGAGVGGTDVGGGDIAFTRTTPGSVPKPLLAMARRQNARPVTASCHRTVVELSYSASERLRHIFHDEFGRSEFVQAKGAGAPSS
jgi:hypothetical protein